MEISEKIKKLAGVYAPECIDIRHKLHRNPELSFVEYKTAACIAEKLAEWNIPHVSMAGTGVVGIIKGSNPESSVTALRADMDALPIQELTTIPFKSTVPKIMHACGHDIHMTVVAFTAIIMKQLHTQ